MAAHSVTSFPFAAPFGVAVGEGDGAAEGEGLDSAPFGEGAGVGAGVVPGFGEGVAAAGSVGDGLGEVESIGFAPFGAGVGVGGSVASGVSPLPTGGASPCGDPGISVGEGLFPPAVSSPGVLGPSVGGVWVCALPGAKNENTPCIPPGVAKTSTRITSNSANIPKSGGVLGLLPFTFLIQAPLSCGLLFSMRFVIFPYGPLYFKIQACAKGTMQKGEADKTRKSPT